MAARDHDSPSAERSLADLRREYARDGLRKAEAGPDPVALFGVWLDDALGAGLTDANAMVLATADAAGEPAGRVVLLKGVESDGFVFFTNYRSRKGRELAENPRAELVAYWGPLERQVRVAGTVEPVPERESDEYFASRPRGAQIGAWASAQSEVIADRRALEQAARAAEARFGDGPVPRPPHWGGYRLVPSVIEFWQGRPDRLHDRLRYTRRADGWTLERLAP